MEAVSGVTAIETSGFVMVRVAVPEMLPWAAMMVEVVFGVTPVARPPAVMVAPTEALQLTLEVMFCVLPSAYFPVAVNCCVPLGATVIVAGVTVIDTSGAGFTVNTVLPVMVPEVEVMVVVPAVTPVASPVVLTVATAGLLETQLAVDVRTLVLPSL